MIAFFVEVLFINYKTVINKSHIAFLKVMRFKQHAAGGAVLGKNFINLLMQTVVAKQI